MSKGFVVIVVAMVLCWGTWAVAQPRPRQSPEGGPGYLEMRELEMRRQAMELEQREAELQFQRDMHALELEQRRVDLERQRAGIDNDDNDCGMVALLIIALAVHILLAVWVYQDITTRAVGSGLWIAITLVTGFLGALLYAVVRLGNSPEEAEE